MILEHELNFPVIRALYSWFGGTPKMWISFIAIISNPNLSPVYLDGEPFPGEVTFDFPLPSSATHFKTAFLEA